MNAQAVSQNMDQMFDNLLDVLEEALDLSFLPDRDDRLDDIAARCATAAKLTSKAIARR
jgi:hypothetical protein